MLIILFMLIFFVNILKRKDAFSAVLYFLQCYATGCALNFRTIIVLYFCIVDYKFFD